MNDLQINHASEIARLHEEIVEGIRRGIRIDCVAEAIKGMDIDPSEVEWWGRVPLEENDEYANRLYDLLEPNWLRRQEDAAVTK